VALAMVHGAAAGLEELAVLEKDTSLAGHYRLDAVKAHLREMSGDLQGAIDCYTIAADRTTSVPEREYLISQAARLAGSVKA